jgi:hypothetical protein
MGTAILRQMPSASPAVRAELIAVLADRGEVEAAPALLDLARDDHPQVRRAALRGLARLGGAAELPTLIRLLKDLKGEGDLAEAELALGRVISRLPGSDRRSSALLDALRTAESVGVRCLLLRLLATVADQRSFDAVAAALTDGDAAVRETAVRVLAEWPDRRAERVLFDLMKSSPSQAERVLALRGYLRLLDTAQDRPPQERARRLAEAMAYARRAEEKRLVVSGLSRAVDRAALDALAAWRDDADVSREVAQAIAALTQQLPADRILFLGNSITLHGPKPDIGWMNNWGMAASAREKDYAHLLLASLARLSGAQPEARIDNIADFERHYDTYDPATGLKKYLEFRPNIVVLAIGENVPALTTDEAKTRFRRSVTALLTTLKSGGQPAIFVRSCFWADQVKDEILRQSCRATGSVFVDIGSLGKDESNYARSERSFVHAGVAAHPGDKGMKAIADAIFQAMRGSGREKPYEKQPGIQP